MIIVYFPETHVSKQIYYFFINKRTEKQEVVTLCKCCRMTLQGVKGLMFSRDDEYITQMLAC